MAILFSDDLWDRFHVGFTATGDCWQIIREDKKLLFLPLLSGISCLLVLASFAVPIQRLHPEVVDRFLDEDAATSALATPDWFWGLVFCFYFANYTVIYFFNAALVHCALFHFRGLPIRMTDGLRAAVRRLPLILAWAAVSATVGLVLRILENSHKHIRGLIDRIFGSTWTIITYFVVPVLVVEHVDPFRAIHRSASILRESWGEAIGGRVGIGWFMLPFWLLAMGLAYVGFHIFDRSHIVGTALVATAVLFALVLGLINSTLESILVAGLYLYATQNETPQQMDKEVLENAFDAKAAD